MDGYFGLTTNPGHAQPFSDANLYLEVRLTISGFRQRAHRAARAEQGQRPQAQVGQRLQQGKRGKPRRVDHLGRVRLLRHVQAPGKCQEPRISRSVCFFVDGGKYFVDVLVYEIIGRNTTGIDVPGMLSCWNILYF